MTNNDKQGNNDENLSNEVEVRKSIIRVFSDDLIEATHHIRLRVPSMDGGVVMEVKAKGYSPGHGLEPSSQHNQYNREYKREWQRARRAGVQS